MRLYPVKTPLLVQKSFPGYTWTRKAPTKTVWITVDDGPTPNFSKTIRKILNSFGLKATFFCVGENIKNHYSEAENLLQDGHKIGNHTYNHLNGWKTSAQQYVDNVLMCRSTIEELGVKNELFRPPYGKLTTAQGRRLIDSGFEIIMWDVLSGDFDPKMETEQCLRLSLKNTHPGSIVVFHDNKKCEQKLEYVLPTYIESLLSQNYNFQVL